MAARIISHYCSSLDSLWPPVLQSWVLCFPQGPGTSPHSTARILRLGLERTIMQRPYLAGIVSRDNRRERLMVTYPIQGDRPDISKFFSVNDLSHSCLSSRSDSWPQSYNQLRQRGMPVSPLLRDRLEAYGGSQAKLNNMPIAAQANFIPGGCLLSITLHHSLFDGFGAESIVAAWARNCKEVQQHGSHYYPEEDIQILALPPPFREPHRPRTGLPLSKNFRKDQHLAQGNYLWELLGMQNPHIQPTSPPTLHATHFPLPQAPQPAALHLTPAIFTASANSIARLKANSTPPPWALADGSWPEISTFDAVASLLWRSILAARLPNLDPAATKRHAPSRLRIPVSIRKSLQISPSYPGNCLLNAVTSFPIRELVSEPDGERTSPMIRASILAARGPVNVRNALQLSRATKTSTSFCGDGAGGPELGLGLRGTCGIMPALAKRVPLFRNSSGADGPDLVLTSWRDLGYYRHDWGDMFSSDGQGCSGGSRSSRGGRPEFVRVPTDYLPGVCILLPSRDCGFGESSRGLGGEESFEVRGPPLDVLVTMPRAQLDRLVGDREFGESFSLLAM